MRVSAAAGRQHGKARRLAAARAAPALVAAALLAGCSTTRVAEPAQTATEQLIVTTAVDHAVAKLHPALPKGARVFVDTTYFDTKNVLFPEYAIGAVRDRLLRLGDDLTDDRKDADVIVELRSGGQSIDHKTFLIGLPAITLPVPLTSNAVTTPEIALFKRDRQTGVAKLAITAYAAHTGALDSSSGPQFGTSDDTRYTVLLFIGWTNTDIEPDIPSRAGIGAAPAT